MSFSELKQQFCNFMLHTGRTIDISIQSEKVSFTLKKGSLSASISVNLYSVPSNCGLVYVHGLNQFFSFTGVKGIFDEGDDKQIVFDFIMSCIEQYILEQYKKNIVNYSIAVGEEQDFKLLETLLERRSKLGITIQVTKTSFVNKNSKNKQYLLTTYIADNRVTVPMDFITQVTVDATNVRAIDLSKYAKFVPFWEKWKEGDKFLIGLELFELESIDKNANALFITIESNNEANIGKELNKKIKLTDTLIPANAIQLKQYYSSIKAEKAKVSEKLKVEELYRNIKHFNPPTIAIVPKANLQTDKIYLFVMPNGKLHTSPFIFSGNDQLRIFGSSTTYTDPSLLESLMEFSNI
jgi:hypothetical protein